MSNYRKVIRLEPNGPVDIGMAEMQLDPGDFQSEPISDIVWVDCDI